MIMALNQILLLTYLFEVAPTTLSSRIR